MVSLVYIYIDKRQAQNIIIVIALLFTGIFYVIDLSGDGSTLFFQKNVSHTAKMSQLKHRLMVWPHGDKTASVTHF